MGILLAVAGEATRIGTGRSARTAEHGSVPCVPECFREASTAQEARVWESWSS